MMVLYLKTLIFLHNPLLYGSKLPYLDGFYPLFFMNSLG